MKQSAADFKGMAWPRWISFAMYGTKLHVLCSINRVLLSYELKATNVSDVLLVREPFVRAGLEEGIVARRLLRALAHRSKLKELSEAGALIAAERDDRHPTTRQQVEVCSATLKRTFRLDGTMADTLAGLATRIAVKVSTPTDSTSTGSSGDLKDPSRSRGPGIRTTLTREDLAFAATNSGNRRRRGLKTRRKQMEGLRLENASLPSSIGADEGS